MFYCCDGFAVSIYKIAATSCKFDAAAELRASVVTGSRWFRLMTVSLVVMRCQCLHECQFALSALLILLQHLIGCHSALAGGDGGLYSELLKEYSVCSLIRNC